MPFTLSHPAAVLPLLRRGRARGPLVGSALVAGSLAPDVPYFADSLLPGSFGYGVLTHSLPGIVTVDVAIAAALVAGWHGLVREPLVDLLPARWAGAAESLTVPGPRSRSRRVADAAWFAASAAVGAATHVGWDAFTHPGRAGVRLIPALNRPLAGQPLYHVLQYGSSALALGALTVWTGRELRRASAGGTGRAGVSARGRAGLLGLVTAAGVAGAVQRVARGEGRGPGGFSAADLIPTVCFGAGAGIAVGLLVYGAAAQVVRAREKMSPPRA